MSGEYFTTVTEDGRNLRVDMDMENAPDISSDTKELLEESIQKRGMKAPVLIDMDDGGLAKGGETDQEPGPGWLEQMYLEDPLGKGAMVDSESRLWIVDVRPAPGNEFASGTPERKILEVRREAAKRGKSNDSEASKSNVNRTAENKIQKCVYVIQNQRGHVKIGVSRHPKSRLDALQTGSPDELSLVVASECEDATKVESRLHSKYEKHRMQGEWFDLPPEDVENAVDVVELMGE